MFNILIFLVKIVNLLIIKSITNLLSAIPVFGKDLVELIWGGFSVSGATLTRFFALHFILPFVLAALVAGHLLAHIKKLGLNSLLVRRAF